MAHRNTINSWWQKKQEGRQVVSAVSVQDTGAYWISPSGKLIPVGKTHIDTVIALPEAFNLTEVQIKEIFDKYGEKLNLEGKARQEIMEGLIANDWIRIRYYARAYEYSIELNKLTKRKKDFLLDWAVGLLKENKKREFVGIRVTEIGNGFRVTETTVRELAQAALHSKVELAMGVREQLIILKSVFEFFEVAPAMRPKVFNL